MTCFTYAAVCDSHTWPRRMTTGESHLYGNLSSMRSLTLKPLLLLIFFKNSTQSEGEHAAKKKRSRRSTRMHPRRKGTSKKRSRGKRIHVHARIQPERKSYFSSLLLSIFFINLTCFWTIFAAYEYI